MLKWGEIMYKKFLVLEVLENQVVCQLPSDVDNRLIEVHLIQMGEPINLSGCEVEVSPKQDEVSILENQKGVVLIKVTDDVKTDFTLQLNIYQQAFLVATISFEVKFEQHEEVTQLKKNQNKHVLFPHAQLRMIAHRGLSSLAPENTLPAYELAGKYGYFGGECDIHETADGEFILMHDDLINRTTNGSGSPGQYTLDELKSFKITDSNYPYLKIPTLCEYLQVCKCQALVPVIEVKRIGTKSITTLLNQIEKWGLLSNCILITFHKEVATEIRKQNKDITLQWLANLTEDNINYCAQYQMNIDCHKKNVTKELIDYAHSVGVLVNVWTVDEQKEMVKLIEMGVDFITTNCLMYRQNIRSNGMCESYSMKNRIDYLRCLNPFLIESHGDSIQDGTFKWHEESHIFEMQGTKKAPATLEINLPQLYKGDVVTVSCEYVNISGQRLSISYGTTKKEFEQVVPSTLVNDWGYVEVQFITLKDLESMRNQSHVVVIGAPDSDSHFMVRNVNVKVDYM